MSDTVDTLNLLTDKLNELFNQTQNYYESFLDTNTLYKNGQISDSDFFKKLGDYTVAYSALEFLSIKVIFEIKKSIDKISNGKNNAMSNSTGSIMTNQIPPNIGGGHLASNIQQLGTNANPLGAPPQVISAQDNFNNVGTLPSPDPTLATSRSTNTCNSCGMKLRLNAKFCTKCGNKI